MLNIFYLLEPFFKDVYREISVREYAKLKRISPPTASKILKNFEKEELLISSKKGIYLFFRANKEHFLFSELSRLYWHCILFNATRDFHKRVLFRKIILFGSLAKVENTKDSDVDLYIDIERRDINVENIEKNLKRKVQLHFKDSLKNINLKNNIEGGIVIR